MIVSEAITLLKNSELKQLSLKDEKPTILGFINLAVLEIYKRFKLWNAEASITMATDVLLYKLDGVDSNVTIDLSDNQLLVIDKVDDQLDAAMVLNDDTDPDSISTPKYNHIEIKVSVPTEILSVTYRAAPKFLTNEKQEIPIPPQFLEALFNYVAYKGHSTIKDDTPGKPNPYYKRFIGSCNLIEMEGIFSQDNLNSSKFKNNIYP